MRSLPLCLGLLLVAPGCIVIPIGDLLKGPPLGEQMLVEGAGFFSKEKIAIIEIDGLIQGHETRQVFFSRENVLAETRARLDHARADSEVQAVVLRISSPGGEVTACDSIYREVKKFRDETKKPVVVSITDVGASGGYYIAMAGDAVLAQPTSIVGSIGVILQSFDLSGLMAKIGVTSAPVKSGPKKDMNSLFRPMTEEEREVLQKLVDDMYGRFLEVVKEGRAGLDEETIREVADGRVVSGGAAAELGLVDGVGYLSDAIAEAQKRAGIESPTIVRYARIQKSGANIYSAAPFDEGRAPGLRWNLEADLPSWPGLYYLWRPGF